VIDFLVHLPLILRSGGALIHVMVVLFRQTDPIQIPVGESESQ